ncbi:MAG TPA: hypothetical protein VGO58_07895 [Chitinophagaceae bacterium]|jgi:hypothetical protein|nr:hypothetical protein [Chitinophagaceae bacterium]
MKKIVVLLLSSSLLLIACNNDKPKDSITITDKEGKEKITVSPSEIKNDMEAMLQRKEELSAMTPLTADELKALIPEELMGGVRTDLDINSAMGATVANADYIIKDSIKLKLEVVDCAGPGGAGMFGMQYLNMFNVNSDDDDEYVKTIEVNGGKAFENCKKKRNRCTLVWFSGNRYLVSLRGDNTGIDALKDGAKGLDIK